MDEQEMAANCGSYDAKCDNEDKADISSVPFLVCQAVVALFLPTQSYEGMAPSTSKFIVLQTIKTLLTCFQSRQTKGETKMDIAHANDTYSVEILRWIENNRQRSTGWT